MPGTFAENFDEGVEKLRQNEIGHAQLHLLGFDLRQIQHLVDQAQKMLAALVHGRNAFLLRLGQALVALENLRVAENAVERRAQLVAHARQKFALGAISRLGSLFGLA